MENQFNDETVNISQPSDDDESKKLVDSVEHKKQDVDNEPMTEESILIDTGFNEQDTKFIPLKSNEELELESFTLQSNFSGTLNIPFQYNNDQYIELRETSQMLMYLIGKAK